MLNIGIETKKTSINIVHISSNKLDVNPKISFVLCVIFGFPVISIQIVRERANNLEN